MFPKLTEVQMFLREHGHNPATSLSDLVPYSPQVADKNGKYKKKFCEDLISYCHSIRYAAH
jgi:hypothetical protein